MSKLWLFFLLLVTIGFPAKGEPLVYGDSYPLHSEVLNEGRTYKVSLPSSYSWAKDREYAVLYVLDAQSAFLHTAATVAHLSGSGDIPEMIVVGIDSTVRIRDFTQSDWSTAWVGGGGADNFKRFLSTELIPAIEGKYRTNGFRILSGHSAGGQFVLYCLTDEPRLFNAYFAIEPNLEWDGNLPQRSLEKSFESRRELESFLYLAQSDNRGQALADYQKLTETLATKAPAKLRWRSQDFPEERHLTLPLLAQVNALRQLYQGYRLEPHILQGGKISLSEHFAMASKTVGWPLPPPEHAINTLGYDALARGDIKEAIELFTDNVDANPHSANARDSLADAYAEAKQWTNAAKAAKHAVALAAEQQHSNLVYFEGQAKKFAELAEAQ